MGFVLFAGHHPRAAARTPHKRRNPLDPANLPTPTLVNPPPDISAVSYAPILKESNDGRDVEINIEIQDNEFPGNDGEFAETTITGLPAPDYRWESDAHGKVASYTFTWKGSLIIKTAYPNGLYPSSHPSGYGRGTGDDVKNGNVTVGFHEWCHQNAFIAYITKSDEMALTGKVSAPHVLPDSDPPVTLPWNYKKFPRFHARIGQSRAAIESAWTAFKREMDHWSADMAKFNDACVHEIYYRFSDYRKDHPEDFKKYTPHR